MKTKFLVIALVVCLFSNAQAQVPSYVPSNGLVGWWPFNGNANDESGNGNNGTVNGSTLTLDRFGQVNKAYYFNGINYKITIPNSISLQLNNGATFSLWFNVDTINFDGASGDFDARLIDKSTPGGVDGYLIDFNHRTTSPNPAYYNLCSQGSTRLRSIIGGSTILTTCFNPYSSWSHLLITFDNGTIKSYLNGFLLDSSLTSNTNIQQNINSLVFGYATSGNSNTWLNGKLDDIGIWNRALTQQEITNLYNSSAYVPCASPAFPANLASGLVGYWPFCGDANDESGNGNNGTVNGATLTSDRFGNPNSAYDFDGSASYIEVLHSTSQNLTNAVSFSLWINPTDYNLNSQASRVPLGKKINATTSGLGFETLDGVGSCCGPQFYLNNNTGAGGLDYEDPVSLVAGSWTHLVGTYDGSILKLYKNSILIGSNTGSISLSSTVQSLFFGREGSSSPNRYFKGLIDDIGFWNRALSASEIHQLYNTGIYFQTVTGSCDTLQFNANITGFNPVTYQNQVKVFPNPAKDNLVIDCGANFNTLTGYSMKILNTVGQSVYNSLITQQVTNIPLTAPTWSPGAYIVQFINPTGTVIEAKQIIIQ